MNELYDPDDVLPKNSPLLAPLRLQLRSASPPMEAKIRTTPTLICQKKFGRRRRMPVQASQGDAVLVGFLGGGRQPEIAQLAGQVLLAPEESDEDTAISNDSDVSQTTATNRSPQPAKARDALREEIPHSEVVATERRSNTMTPEKQQADTIVEALKALAAGALAAVAKPTAGMDRMDPGPTPPTTGNDVVTREPAPSAHHVPPAIATRHDLPCKDDRIHLAPSPFTPLSLCSPRETGPFLSTSKMPPTNGYSSGGRVEGLPPIQNSLVPESQASTPLPSISQQLGDLGDIQSLKAQALAQQAQQERDRAGGIRRASCSYSPHGMHRLSCQGSPPVSPVDAFRGEARSPSSFQAARSPTSSYYYNYHAHTIRLPPEYGKGLPEYASSPAGTPTSEKSAPTTGASVSLAASSSGGMGDPANAGLAHASTGSFICHYPGCNAQPFNTQYLLNSHANVHSQDRPHYCPQKGCPRSVGGKGFKRKNEMIRHGLVHDSPGYICPFCPDREHKYPRPDNLQRHVRVHHVDKDKDHPLLRDVLAQRPDGPSRGRRRRALAV